MFDNIENNVYFERVNITPSRSVLFNVRLDVRCKLQKKKTDGLLLANTIAGTRYMARGNPIYVEANATSRYVACFDTPIGMILLSALVTARRELSYLLRPPSRRFPRLPIFFFVICTPNRAELLPSYGNDDGVGGGGSSGSRKSQINPFVIPHRSFQPVRISTTSLLCHLRTLPKLFPFSLPSPCRPVKRDSTILLSLSVSPLSPSDITLFSPFFFSYPFLSIPVVPLLGSLAPSASSFFFSFISCSHIPFA